MAASTPPFDALIVEASGISEPQQVAEAFDLPEQGADEDGDHDDGMTAEQRADLVAASALLKQHARLDCAVSVVDALQFPLDAISSRDSLADRGQAAGPDDRRAVSQLLIQQVEFADVLVLNKCDLASKSQRESVRALMQILNPRARIIEATRSAVDPQALLKCNSFSMEVARATPGWLQSLSGKALPESVEFGITHVVFRARRPFHPARLHDLIFGRRRGGPSGCLYDTVFANPLPKSNPLHAVVRSKGCVWLAAPISVSKIIYWAQAGRAFTFEPGEPWIALLDDMAKRGLELEDDLAQELKDGHALARWDSSAGLGDRETELVFIGVSMDGPAVLAALQTAVVTESEWAAYLADAAIVAAAEVDEMVKEARGDEEEEDEAAESADGDAMEDDAPELATIDSAQWLGPWDFSLPEVEDEDDEEEEEEDEEEAAKAKSKARGTAKKADNTVHISSLD